MPAVLFLLIIVPQISAQTVNWSSAPNWISSGTSEYTMSVALEDLDNDGDLEFIEGNYKYPYLFPAGHPESLGEEPGTLEIGAYLLAYEWRNGALMPPVKLTSEDSPRCIDCIAAADYDDDGDVDIALGLVVGAGNDGGVLILRNQLDLEGPPQILSQLFIDDPDSQYSWHSETSFDCHCVRWVDIDSDGDLDLAALEIPGRLRVYKNTNGVLDTESELYTFKAGTTIEFGDLDSDGDFDLYINSQAIAQVHRNRLSDGSPWYYSENEFWEDIEEYRDAPLSAAFGFYGTERTPALAVGSFVTANQNISAGTDIYTYDDTEGGQLVHVGRSQVNDNAQITTDLQWLHLNQNDEMDLVSVSYAVCKSEDQTLYWDSGFEQRHFDPESSMESGEFAADTWTDQTDLSLALAVGDINYPDSLTRVEVHNCYIDDIENGIIYLENFPFYRVDSVSFASESSPSQWESVPIEQWCSNASDGWVSIDKGLIDTYTGPQFQWQEFWVRISYSYSLYYDLAVGNDGVNAIYSAFGAGDVTIPVNEFTLPDFPPFDPSSPYTYQQPAELDNPDANLMASDALCATGPIPYEPYDISPYFTENPNINRYGLTSNWDMSELFKGHYFWDWLDKNLDEIHSRGFKSHLCSFETPFWTRGNLNNTSPNSRTSDERLHTMWVRNLVNRYRPDGIFSETGAYQWDDWGITEFQFENEPNMACHGYGYEGSAIEAMAEKIYREYQMIKQISYVSYPDDTNLLKVISPNFALTAFPEYPEKYMCPPLSYLNPLNDTDLDFIDNGEYDSDKILWRFCDYMMQQAYNGYIGRNDDEFSVFQDPFTPVYANGDSDLKVGPEHLFWGWYTEGISEYLLGTPDIPEWDPVMRISEDPPQYSLHPFFLVEWSFLNDWYGSDLGVDDLLPQEDWISAQIAEIFSIDIFPKSDSLNQKLVAYSANWLAADWDYDHVFNTHAPLLNNTEDGSDTSNYYFEGYDVLDPGGEDEPNVYSYCYTNGVTNERLHFVRTLSDTAAPTTTIVGVNWDYPLLNNYEGGELLNVYSPGGELSQKEVALRDTCACVQFVAEEMYSAMTILQETPDTVPVLNPGRIPGDPKPFELHQNSPNPFNPVTTIQFNLPSETHVKLVVYDAQGRKVESLVDGNLKAGLHEVQYTASGLSSGVYFYKLEAGDNVAVKKLVLIK